jgi:FIST N domain.
MQAKTIHGSTPEDIRRDLLQSQSDGFSPTLAIVFISIKQDRKAVGDLLQQEGIDMIGATSSGEFINGHQSEGETVVMLLDIPKSDYCILFEDIGERTLPAAATNMARKALQKFDQPAFILCSTLLAANGQMIDGENLIRSIEQIVGPQVNLFGGMAGDDITFTGAYVFTHDQSTDYGMVALVLDETKISLRGVAISGWQPLGVSRTVPKVRAT